jgi:hypothetical protein
MSVERKVAVVTGGSQGIGAALVKAFRERDYRRPAQIFVVALGASNFAYAETSWTKEQHGYEQVTYMLAWDTLAEREKRWGAFLADPEWNATLTETEKDGPLVQNISSQLLAPTAFSSVSPICVHRNVGGPGSAHGGRARSQVWRGRYRASKLDRQHRPPHKTAQGIFHRYAPLKCGSRILGLPLHVTLTWIIFRTGLLRPPFTSPMGKLANRHLLEDSLSGFELPTNVKP